MAICLNPIPSNHFLSINPAHTNPLSFPQCSIYQETLNLFNQSKKYFNPCGNPIPGINHVSQNLLEELKIFKYRSDWVSDKISEIELVDFICNHIAEQSNGVDAVKIVALHAEKKLSKKSLSLLLNRWRPKLNAHEIERLQEKYSSKEVLSVLDILSKLYVFQFANKATPSDFAVLQLFQSHLDKESFSFFWEDKKKIFSDITQLQHYFSGLSHLAIPKDFLKWLYAQGCPAHLFNTYIPNLETTLLQEFARNGDIEFVKKVAQEIPSDQMRLGDSFFQEEWNDCIQKTTPTTDLSQFRLNNAVIGQNGCRSVLFTDQGRVYSLPSQNAKMLSQQLMPPTSDAEPVTIYLNPNHASMDFRGNHIGFYPINSEDSEAIQEYVKNIIIHGNALAGVIVGSETRNPSIIAGIIKDECIKCSGTTKLSLSYKRCHVQDDSKAKRSNSNGLILTVYATKDQVDKIHQYVHETTKRCASGEVQYHPLNNNCILFIQQAFKSAGIAASFLDSFHTIQYLRRPGQATLFSMGYSKDPVIHDSNKNTTILTKIDRMMSRNIPNYVVRVPLQITTIGRSLQLGIKRVMFFTFLVISKIQKTLLSLRNRFQ